MTPQEIAKLIQQGRSKELSLKDLEDARIPYIPALRPKENPDYSEINKQSKPVPLDLCYNCYPFIYQETSIDCKGNYKCLNCGTEVTKIMVRVPVTKWW